MGKGIMILITMEIKYSLQVCFYKSMHIFYACTNGVGNWILIPNILLVQIFMCCYKNNGMDKRIRHRHILLLILPIMLCSDNTDYASFSYLFLVDIMLCIYYITTDSLNPMLGQHWRRIAMDFASSDQHRRGRTLPAKKQSFQYLSQTWTEM